jgi:hypothetical protein
MNHGVFRSPRFTILLGLLLGACLIVRKVEVDEMSKTASDSVRVRSAGKAHLLDGSTVVHPDGVLVAEGTLRGRGTRYDLTLANPVAVQAPPLDSVVGMENFLTGINAGAMVA